ncbi:hypothetical protein UB31_21320 [Bradyrhizobium sp. LTSP849]|uniref:hypothetical protein n=1 Tax=Bradyrhizobium sp. LTSP849 TaxID=1615890 RepID=UPI0005D201CA|nr:hypothetical protein [Bradyrhizobium sp. LTSP849]KJC44114.1 hypothetical protein UB31_21320 [Bradyrhizobium sp. LTSP849]
MNTADWALVISICSAATSLAGFVWNVWSKFIYPKPRVQVSFSMVRAIRLGVSEDDPPRALMLSATNMGPSEVTLRSALVKFKPYWFSEVSHGLLNTLPTMPMSTDYETEYEMGGGGPFAAGFPKKLAVGESFSAYLVPDHETLAKGNYERIGFDDSFNRMHWAPRRQILTALPSIREACQRSSKDWRPSLR